MGSGAMSFDPSTAKPVFDPTTAAPVEAKRPIAAPAPAPSRTFTEARDAADQRFVKAYPQTTTPEAIAGHPMTRFALGAASPFLGAAQLGSEALGFRGVTDHLKQLEEAKQTGRKEAGSSGFDPIETAGAVLSPAFLGAAKALPAAGGVMGRAAQGAAVGGLAGATAPVSEGNDYWGSKGGQVLIGTVLGGAVPPVIDAASAGARGVGNVANLFLPGGEKRIATNYQRRLIGEQQVPNVVQALRTPPANPVPGYEQTAAERLVGLPGGSPVQAHQRIQAQQPGGISAQFGQRITDQKAALQNAAQSRDDALLPMARSILERANQNGVEVAGIEKGIEATLGKPGVRASDVVQRTMASIKEKLGTSAPHGIVDANDLWTIRKEIGNTIKTHAKDTANWDKRMTAGLERDVQKAIDDAIEQAGGAGWKQFMAEYSKRSQAIRDTADAAKNAYRPVQRTEVGGGINVAEETRTKLPQMLSRPMMATNWVLKKLGAGVEQRIDPELARRYLNPEELAKALEQLPVAQRAEVVQQLVQLGRVPAIVGAQQQQQ
jgi:hypothetical protein